MLVACFVCTWATTRFQVSPVMLGLDLMSSLSGIHSCIHIYLFSFCWLSDVIPAQHLMQSKRGLRDSNMGICKNRSFPTPIFHNPQEPQQLTVNPNFETPEKSLNPKHNPALRNSGYTFISPQIPKEQAGTSPRIGFRQSQSAASAACTLQLTLLLTA